MLMFHASIANCATILRMAKARLTLLSPKIIHKLILGEADLSMQALRRGFPMVWEKQESELLK